MTFAERLYRFQAEAVDFAVSQPGVAMLCEQGTGKTFIASGVIERLVASRAASTHLLVVLLANVETTWERALAQLDGVSVHRDWPSFRDSRAPHRILLMHYEAFRGKVVARIIRKPWTSVIFDESHRLKKRSSKASRAAARFRQVDHRLVLSGTPVEQAPQDLWAQLRFAAPDVLGRSWEEFSGKWLRPCGFMGYDREFKWKLLPKFLRRIAPVVFRVTKGEVLSLPPVVRVRERVPLLGEQARVYEDLIRDGVTRLACGRRIVCDMAITEMVRLQQITGGFIRDDGDSFHLGDAKRRRLGVVLRREHARHGPVVVFCNFAEEIDVAVSVAVGLFGAERVGVLRGKTRKTRSATIDAFQAGDLDVLVSQVRAGGVGVDLFRSCVVVFYSLPHSSIYEDQAISRLHRNGQTRAVRIVTLLAVNTVDELIASALQVKRTVSQQVLDDHRKKRTNMAKPETKPAPKAEAKTETKTEKTKPTPPPVERPKYGVPELAEAMGVKATSLRVRLRSASIPKKGKVYGWDTKAEMQAVADKLKASGRKPAAGKSKDADEETDGD